MIFCHKFKSIYTTKREEYNIYNKIIQVQNSGEEVFKMLYILQTEAEMVQNDPDLKVADEKFERARMAGRR